MSNFNFFRDAVAAQFKRMSAYPLFRTAATGDELWSTYLSAFPEGSNPIYKTRTTHDCTCCKQFIRAVGNVVAIRSDGSMMSIWDSNVLGSDDYQAVADAMAGLVRSKPIVDAFLHYESTAGTAKSLQDTLDGVKTWTHFFVNIPKDFVKPKDSIATLLSHKRAAHDVLARGLAEITVDALDIVLELIVQNSLYRGAEHYPNVKRFYELKREYEALKAAGQPTDSFVWAQCVPNSSVSLLRNTSIGTLLVALSEGKDLESAVKAFEVMVAPANYKRPTALVTKAMVERAKATLSELGLTSALTRRYARLEDITVNNVLYADRASRAVMTKDVFDELMAATPASPKTYNKVEEVPIEKFIADILPSAKKLELFFENQHAGNLVSLIAPEDPTAQQLFKWSNGFSWSYTGDVADSIKERVKKAGGNIDAELCCRLAWEYADDLDLHMIEPRNRIYFGVRRSPATGGCLDVDANGADGIREHPVENIYYTKTNRMVDGNYRLAVNNYNRRSDGIGFEVEIDLRGETWHLVYDRVLPDDKTIYIAEIKVRNSTITVTPLIPEGAQHKTLWGLTTKNFHTVSALMLSPNFWDGQLGIGNKHYFFMLEGCRNDGQARGFYNEFLRSDLNQHRKVIEMVGAKLKTEANEQQLSGLGFSSTQRNSVLCRVTGAITRAIRIVF